MYLCYTTQDVVHLLHCYTNVCNTNAPHGRIYSPIARPRPALHHMQYGIVMKDGRGLGTRLKIQVLLELVSQVTEWL